MKKILMGLIFVASAATAAPALLLQPSTAELQDDAAEISRQVTEAQTESEKYAGGLIKTQIESRIAVLKLTRAIIDQRIIAIKTGTKPKIEAPASQARPEEATLLVKEIVDIDSQIGKIQKNADQYAGGLILAQLKSTIATLQSTRAMVQQRMLTIKYGLGLPQKTSENKPAAGALTRAATKTAKSGLSAAEKIVTVELLNKVYKEKKYGHGIYFDLTFTAAWLEKPARAIKGYLLINDLFGEKIMGIKWNLDKPMAPGESQIETATGFDYNQFMSNHQRVRDTEQENLRVTFQVDSILYEDGTRQDF